ncbi:MAG TPA: phosphoribosylglycinamide formyltransferase [Candidatus Moranbacteria bacterium]|nr:phosphoribosylglycinamide formyltransferase [Candidatus Moranbacteria bacterium]HBT45603.1 phosphoribosylglycinamide formyltransferase [Candidatus Moranbacteria bacterium]
MKLQLGVLASGRGSNFVAIDDNCNSGILQARVVCVISDIENAPVIEIARKRGIPTFYLNPKEYAGKKSYNKAIIEVLKLHGVQLVVLAGYMRIIDDVLIDAFPNAIMNIHPSLLPSFPGLHAQLQALEYGVKYSGCTVHFVDKGKVDTGSIIIQAIVPVLDNDDEDSLSARILKKEHVIYSEAIKLFAQHRLRLTNDSRVVRILAPKKFNPR